MHVWPKISTTESSSGFTICLNSMSWNSLESIKVCEYHNIEFIFVVLWRKSVTNLYFCTVYFQNILILSCCETFVRFQWPFATCGESTFPYSSLSPEHAIWFVDFFKTWFEKQWNWKCTKNYISKHIYGNKLKIIFNTLICWTRERLDIPRKSLSGWHCVSAT